MFGKKKLEYLGKGYEFDHIGVSSFDLYKKENGVLVRKGKQGSPYLTKNSHFLSYINILESKGYKPMTSFTTKARAI